MKFGDRNYRKGIRRRLWKPASNRLCCLSLVIACSILALAIGGVAAAADGPRWVTQLVRKLPRTNEEVQQAFEKSRNASIQIAVGEPLEVPDFSLDTVYDITIGGKKEKVKFQFARMGALTFGLQLSKADEANLPSVSKARITRRVANDYISIQIRPQRDVSTGAIYLYYKPFAAIGTYHMEGTQEFAPLMEDSVANFRGLGLFVRPGTPITAENLRTLVAVNHTLITDEKDPDAPMPALFPTYEFTFVRARVEGEKVTLHTFVTNEYRRMLHYLKPYAAPTSPEQCSVWSVILFTEYSVAKQSPSAKALRHTCVNAQASFKVADLDAFAASQNWQGDALDNLTATLDAIIDGQVRPQP